jgi:hypothetical protein
MILRVKVQKIYCQRTTIELGADEIYFAAFVAAAKESNGQILPIGNPLHKHVSEVKTGVRKGVIPRDQDFEFTVDIEDATAFAISFALYEKDNGQLYNQLQDGDVNEIIAPGSMEWPEELQLPDDAEGLAEMAGNVSQLNWAKIAKVLLKVFKKAYTFFRQDDKLGEFEILSKTDIPAHEQNVPMEFNIRKMRGKYDISISFSIE